jgi:hypothetical protein
VLKGGQRLDGVAGRWRWPPKHPATLALASACWDYFRRQGLDLPLRRRAKLRTRRRRGRASSGCGRRRPHHWTRGVSRGRDTLGAPRQRLRAHSRRGRGAAFPIPPSCTRLPSNPWPSCSRCPARPDRGATWEPAADASQAHGVLAVRFFLRQPGRPNPQERPAGYVQARRRSDPGARTGGGGRPFSSAGRGGAAHGGRSSTTYWIDPNDREPGESRRPIGGLWVFEGRRGPLVGRRTNLPISLFYHGQLRRTPDPYHVLRRRCRKDTSSLVWGAFVRRSRAAYGQRAGGEH